MPGGQIENSETLIEGVIREVQEETGTTIEITDLVGVYSNIAPPTKVIFTFMADYIDGALTPSDESPELAWVPEDEALARITHPALRLRAEDALAFVGKVVYRAYTMSPFTIHDRREV